MTDRHINADRTPLFRLIALVDDGIDGDRRFAGTAVADDELALSATDRHERVDCFDSGLHRYRYVLSIDNTVRLTLHSHHSYVLKRPFAIDGLSERIDYASKQFVAGWHGEHFAGRFDRHAFLYAGSVT